MQGNQVDRLAEMKRLEPADMNSVQKAVYIAVFQLGMMQMDRQSRLDWVDVKVVSTALLSWIVLAIFVLLSATLFVLDYRIADGEYRLFQRSGAALVLASTFVEVWSGIKLRYDQNRLDFWASFPPSDVLRSIYMDSRNYASDGFMAINRKFTVVGWITMGLGTLIWACGDVPYAYFL